MPSLLDSLFSSTSETTIIERKSLLRLPDSPKVSPQVKIPIMPMLPLSLSKSPFSLNSPLLFSTPNADVPSTSDNDLAPSQEVLTQEFLERLQKLRQDEVVVADEARPAFLSLQQVADDLRSELLAARLQLEEKEIEIRELQEQLQAISPPDALQPFISKSKRKKMKKTQRIEAAVAAADTTLPPGCDSFTLPPPPPPRPHQRPAQRQAYQQQQPQNQQQLPPGCTSLPLGLAPIPLQCSNPQQQQQQQPNLYIFHDSNLKNVTPAEINKYIRNNNNNYNIVPQETFTLPQTFNKIRQTKFKPNDSVIINILTNDARQTQQRNRRTPDQTRQLQTNIIQHLLQHIPRQNITILESPPLLDSTSSDIFPYNHASVLLTRKFQIRFADTLVGEQDLWKDGYHLLRSSRHLLVKSVAAAAAHFSPHQRFSLSRPPFGENGPWAAPKGQGVFPREFRHMAVVQPMSFRRRRAIQPLMGMNIQRPR